MNKIELLTKAINERIQIDYDYIKNGVSEGRRIGNPHVLFVFKAKNGKESTKCDIFQVAGGTESGELETFKMCNIDSLDDIKLTEKVFNENYTEYNPSSDRYLFAIAKV